MASTRGRTGSLNLLHFLLGVFLVPSFLSLELLPSANQVLLNSSSNYSVVCSGWSQVTWLLPAVPEGGVIQVEPLGSSSVLRLLNASWRDSGRYTCEEAGSPERRQVDVFIPGTGPEEWFVPRLSGVVMQVGLEDTVPCGVSDPRLNVSLFERHSRTPVTTATYEPGRGFTGKLNDTSYTCTATGGGAESQSQVYYVFSIVVPQQVEVYLSVSRSVLKVGESLMVNCTVRDIDMVFFTWDFPRRQEVEPLTDFLPNQIRSFVNISSATVEDSGVYVCEVQETLQGQTAKKNVTITVLERGYLLLWPSGETHLSALLHHTVTLSVEADAHPPPTVLWTKDNNTVATETSAVNTTHLTGSRYLSTLTLVGVRLHQTGSYTASVSNEDEAEEVVFNLEVKAPPRITSLSEVGSQEMLCVAEGAPPPNITWYTCHSSHRCSNVTGGWRSKSAASEDNVTKDIGITTVRSVLSLQALTSVSAVRCEARNSAGRRTRDRHVQSSSLLSQVLVLAAVLVLVVIAIFFLIVLIVLWRKKPRYEARWKLMESVSPDGPQNILDLHSWEIPRNNVVLGQVLGSGAFGRVVEASVSDLIHSHSNTKVAVKMVKQRSGVQSLVSELKVLMHIGPHLNLVNLLGACTRGGPVYLITEFCRHGDLVNYLQRNKHTFLQSDTHTKSDGDGGYMDMTSETQYVTVKELSPAHIQPAEYEELCTPAGQQEAPQPLSAAPPLSLMDLLSFSFQIAQAMDFLSSRNVVHRDLAARNVLVCEGKLLKVCDFSLARDLMKDQDYIARGTSFLPVRWMSPESLFQNLFSCQSDVWSYGVLLWELFSLGASPYPELPRTQDFCSSLKTGNRMTRPEHAPLNMYDLMKVCWAESPQSRPSFSSLVVSVGNLLMEDYRKRYLQLTEDFLSSPAVLRSRRSSPGADGGPTDAQKHGSPDAQVLEVGPEEAGSSHTTYIIPITDVTIETRGGAAQDAASPQLSQSQDTQEGTSPEDTQEGTSPEDTQEGTSPEDRQEGTSPEDRQEGTSLEEEESSL
ncbi:LOW QUALITY PROTEIN: platelet-derived growth factor receptor beta-like [Trematomus bernacchii]|uniref:LOW QUALITY PROTEIN: platelet-derived growth factor receptor beta-like n=1 Tax=Trematomus bernacchii TaxID=40690 RepID=UPI00146CE1D9|nr:LOW QUALITY PROTEIN: platelet-derived growth factor receptor beta-like [Trematomus bernacchii]